MKIVRGEVPPFIQILFLSYRLLAFSVALSGKETCGAYINELTLCLEAGNVNILECLFDKSLASSHKSASIVPEYTEVIFLVFLLIIICEV